MRCIAFPSKLFLRATGKGKCPPTPLLHQRQRNEIGSVGHAGNKYVYINTPLSTQLSYLAERLHIIDAPPESLLLVELAMERLPEDLPVLKAAWLTSGDFAAFKVGLRSISERAWTISVAKFQPISLMPLW